MINKQEWVEIREEIQQVKAEASGELSALEEYLNRVMGAFHERIQRLEKAVLPSAPSPISLMPPQSLFQPDIIQGLPTAFRVTPSELMAIKAKEEEERRMAESLIATQDAEKEKELDINHAFQSQVVDTLVALTQKLASLEDKLSPPPASEPAPEPEQEEAVDPNAPLHTYTWGGNYSTDAYRRSVDDLRINGNFS